MAKPREHESHIIAAVRDEVDLQAALASPLKTVFLLSADIRSLKAQCDALHQARKRVFLHFDLVNGLKGDASGVCFAAEQFRLNGIISTKAQILKFAREAGLMAILRVFVLDSSALKTGLQHAQTCQPHFVEVLPGVSRKIIMLASQQFGLPVIAGGLIQDEDDVAQALAAGAAAVSTSHRELWR